MKDQGVNKIKMAEMNKINFKKTALILIDMQNESTPNGFWKTYGWDNIVINAKKVLEQARKINLPIIFVRVAGRVDGIDTYEYCPTDENGNRVYSVRGTDSVEIVDELKPGPEEIIVEKQRFSAFYQTNMDLVLRRLKVQELIMLGVYTDSCFLTSVYDAFTRDYRISIIKDACGAGTEAAHKTSIIDMANWIYGCRIFKTEEMIKAMENRAYKCWQWEKAHSMPYTTKNIDEVYEKI